MRTRVEPGQPCWSELACTSSPTTLEFYRRVLGWEYSEPDEELGGYRNALVDGEPVAGIFSLGDEELPAQWLTYLHVPDAREGLARCTSAGARPVLPVTEHVEGARIALIATPGQIIVGLWEGAPLGALGTDDVLRGPCWYEAVVPNLEASGDFLERAFGIRVRVQEDDESGAYGTAQVDGRPFFGLIQTGLAAGSHTTMLPFFLVEDVSDVVERARSAGGGVLLEPTDSPYGRYAYLTGPDMEAFALLQADYGDRDATRRTLGRV